MFLLSIEAVKPGRVGQIVISHCINNSWSESWPRLKIPISSHFPFCFTRKFSSHFPQSPRRELFPIVWEDSQIVNSVDLSDIFSGWTERILQFKNLQSSDITMKTICHIILLINLIKPAFPTLPSSSSSSSPELSLFKKLEGSQRTVCPPQSDGEKGRKCSKLQNFNFKEH